MQIAFLRHGPTEWSQAKRLQGRTDVELSVSGRETVRSWVMPSAMANWPRYCSPLIRTQQTAHLLTPSAPFKITPELIETKFGDYEGRSIAEWRSRLGQRFTDNEARGLDFTPPNGESPRQVRERLARWFAKLAQTASTPDAFVAISHKGVIRAVLSLATEWDMKSDPSIKLEWQHLHQFHYEREGGGKLTLVEANIPLDRQFVP